MINLYEINGMKSYILVFAFLIVASMAPEPVPPQDAVLTSIIECLQQGDARKLSAYFTKTIDIGLPDKDNTYSVTQGELVMKEFFKKFPPTSFISDQQDAPSESSYYALGTYTSGKSKFKTLIYLKKEGNSWKLHKLKFEAK